MKPVKKSIIIFVLLCCINQPNDAWAGKKKKHKKGRPQQIEQIIQQESAPLEPLPSQASSQRDEDEAHNQIIKRVRWSQTKREAAKFCSCALKLGVNCAAAWCFKDNAGAMIVLSSYIYSQIQSDLPYLISKVTPASMNMSDRQKYQMILNQLEVDYEVRKSRTSEFNQQIIEKMVKETQERVDQIYGKSSDPMLEQNLSRLKTILTLPLKRAQSKDSVSGEEELERHLATFSPAIRDELMKYRLQTGLLVERAEKGQSSKAYNSRTSFMFIGEAGTGKTTTAEALALSEGRPFCKISASKLKEDELTGKLNGSSVQLGAITKCFTQPDIGSPAINPYIFIDEIHDFIGSDSDEAKRIYSFIKRLTDPEQMEIEDDALGIKNNLKEVTIVLGSNVDYDQLGDVANALQSRMVTIHFPSLTLEQKTSIAKDHLSKLCQTYGYQPKSKDLKIRNAIVNWDQEPGARVLKKVLEDYVVHQIAVLRGKMKDPHFDIARSFSKNGASH